MIDRAWEWGTANKKIRRNPVHGEEECKLILTDEFEMANTNSHETEQSGSIDVEEGTRMWNIYIYRVEHVQVPATCNPSIITIALS